MAINQIIIPNRPRIPKSIQRQVRTPVGNVTFDIPTRPSSRAKKSYQTDKGTVPRPESEKKPYNSTISQRGGKFSVENFRSKVANDLLIPNTYALFIPAPQKILNLPSSKGMLENLTMRIDNIELPGKQLETEEVIYYGPSRKSAFSMSYEDCLLYTSPSPRDRG